MSIVLGLGGGGVRRGRVDEGCNYSCFGVGSASTFLGFGDDVFCVLMAFGNRL